MTEEEEKKINTIRIMLGVSDFDENIISVYLDIAKNIILNRLYPFGIPDGVEDIPTRFISNQLNIAIYLINKRGGEGETAHSENGVSRTYGSASVPMELLDDIDPYPVVVGDEES